MRAEPASVYASFTTGWEGWLAMPGALLADPKPHGQLFFVVEFEGRRHPHYGRFLELDPDRKVDLTWVTGSAGTQGAETVLSVEIRPLDHGCRVTLSHRGFCDQERADHHGRSWETILANLDDRISGRVTTSA